MIGFVDSTPDDEQSARLRATLPAAEVRADDALASLADRGFSFGRHPLSELLTEDSDEPRSNVA